MTEVPSQGRDRGVEKSGSVEAQQKQVRLQFTKAEDSFGEEIIITGEEAL